VQRVLAVTKKYYKPIKPIKPKGSFWIGHGKLRFANVLSLSY